MDSSLPALIGLDPSCYDVLARALPLAMEGVSGTDAYSSASTMTSRDPLAASPSIWPMPDTITQATDGAGHASPSGATMIAPGYDPPITATTTSACIGGVLSGCVVLATIGAPSVVGSLIYPIVDNGIATVIR